MLREALIGASARYVGQQRGQGALDHVDRLVEVAAVLQQFRQCREAAQRFAGMVGILQRLLQMQGVAFEFAPLPALPFEAAVDEGGEQRETTEERDRGDDGNALSIAVAGLFVLCAQRGFAAQHRFGKLANRLDRIRNQRDDVRVGGRRSVRTVVAEDTFELRATRADCGPQPLHRGDLDRIVCDQALELLCVVFHRRDVAPILLEIAVAAGQAIAARVHLGKLKVADQCQDLLAHLVSAQRLLVGNPIQRSGHEHRCRERQDEYHGRRRHGQNAATQARVPVNPGLKGFHLPGWSLLHHHPHTGEWLRPPAPARRADCGYAARK